MNNLSTELANALINKESVDEIFRQHLEYAVNELLKAELTAFLGYEKSSTEGYNSGNSRNGFSSRCLDTPYGTLHINIPRDRNSEFNQQLIPDYARRDADLENAIFTLYRRGITTREIAGLIEKMYGHAYSPATISNISKSFTEQLKAFHERKLSERYVVIFADATYLSIRRDCVAKEALHVLLGITPDGRREIIDFALFPTEAAANYEEMLASIKQRGVSDVLLFVSDGLKGMRDAVKRQFPASEHQQCWVHLSRTVSRQIRQKDRPEVLADLKNVYGASTEQLAKEEMTKFLGKHEKNYPRLKLVFKDIEQSLYQFYKFPKEIRASLYTSNIIENSNKLLKRRTKLCEQFPNEDSLLRHVCNHYIEENLKHSNRVFRGFGAASAEIEEMFEKRFEQQK